MSVVTAFKRVRQPLQLTPEILRLMETFRLMVNDCIEIGLLNDASTLKKLCSMTYKRLASYDIISYYKPCAISHAAGILANRKKSIMRGLQPRKPYATRPVLASCYGFKVSEGTLKIALGNKLYYEISLNSHVRKVLSDSTIRIRSFTLTKESVTICYSKEVEIIGCTSFMGVDRNLRNLTIGDNQQVRQYDLSKAVDIAENTRSILKTLKRNDVRIRKRLYGKYGKRRKNRTSQLLHNVSKSAVKYAKENETAIVFEDIRRIRQLYRRGNWQGRAYRGRMNSWSFSEIKRQIEYKAKWEGVPVIQLSKSETRGTSQVCPQCGKKITQVDKMNRQLWCDSCRKWMDRDVVAAMNISIKGLARFASSQGLAGEAMKGNAEREPLILRVDASKSSLL